MLSLKQVFGQITFYVGKEFLDALIAFRSHLCMCDRFLVA